MQLAASGAWSIVVVLVLFTPQVWTARMRIFFFPQEGGGRRDYGPHGTGMENKTGAG